MCQSPSKWGQAKTGSKHTELRQVRVSHQVAVAFAGGAAAFVEGPYHETLSTSAITGGEHPFEARRIFPVFGFHIRPRIALYAKLIEQWLFRSKKAHREQDKLCRSRLFRTW